MQAYHNDPLVKEKYVGRVIAHRKADNIIQGQGWDGKKGCAVGCTLENYEHKQYPIELGVPIQLARIEDVIFEGLPVSIAMDWPARFLESIPVGADLQFVFPKFNLWLLQGVFKHARTETTKKSIENVIKIYEEWVLLKKPSSDAFLSRFSGLHRYWRYRYAADAAAAAADADAAAAAAADAAADAADAAADAAAAAAADAAADAADDVADAVAVAAAVAAAVATVAAADAADAAAAYYRSRYYFVRTEARHKFWIAAADKLIELLAEAK